MTFTPEDGKEFYRDFCRRNGISHRVLATILGRSRAYTDNKIARGTVRLRDFVNLRYFTEAFYQNAKPEAENDWIGAMGPTAEDKERIDNLIKILNVDDATVYRWFFELSGKDKETVKKQLFDMKVKQEATNG